MNGKTPVAYVDEHKPGRSIRLEMHMNPDQFIYIEKGMGLIKTGRIEILNGFSMSVYRKAAPLLFQPEYGTI